jgi:protease IV
MGRKRHGFLWLGLALSLGAGTAGAQPTPLVQQQRLVELGKSVASTDDSTALVLNPANLAFIPGSELRWTGTFLNEDVTVPWQGHAFGLAIPLPFSLTTGFRFDVVDPPRGAETSNKPDYQWFTWGLALKQSDIASIGLSLERSFSHGPFGDHLFGLSLATTTRPFDFLGISFVAQDVNSPSNAAGTLGGKYTAALAVRPLGTRTIDIGLEASYTSNADVWVPRGTLGIDIPYVGRLLGEFDVIRPEDSDQRAWLASLGLAFNLNRNDGSAEFSGGAFTGTALGQDDSYNAYAGVAFKGYPEPVGTRFGRYAIRVRLEETPNDREHVRLLRGLWQLAEVKELDGIMLELRTDPADSMAHVQELRDAIYYLRQNGKRVVCHLEDASGAGLYLCAAANQILINPAGNIRFAGLATQHLYFARLLKSIGVRAEVVRFGDHKSAPERFTSEGASDVSRADKIDLLQQYERNITEGLSVGRDMTFADVRNTVKNGPFLASEAKAAGLVDGLAFDDELELAMGKALGRGTPLIQDNRRRPAPSRFGPQPAVAMVYVEGDMVDGRSSDIPLLGTHLAGSYTIADNLKQARENPNIKVVVLRVETPGGSSMAADVIWRQVQLTAKVKPVIVSMGSFAASGGYYIAAPGTRVFASPLTITGSIGVFYGKADVSQLVDKLGIDVEVYKTTERADAESIFHPFTEQERVELTRKIGQVYDIFLDRVAQGRKLTKAQVDAVGQGRVWTGEQAQKRKLVDEIGGLRQALAYARRLVDLPDNAPIVELPPVRESLLGRLLGVPGVSDEVAVLNSTAGLGNLHTAPQLKRIAKALAPFLIHSGNTPLMRLDIVAIDP